jgi:hypothetical protein
MASIEDIGLLHPIIINTEGKLKVGYRRLTAFKRIGEVPEARGPTFALG